MNTKIMLDVAGGGYKSTPTSRFQDSVRNLIGLDSVSVRKAQLSYLKNRNRRKNRIKKK
jgi:ribosomal protein L19